MRPHESLKLIGALCLGLAISSCSCGTADVQQRRPVMVSDFISDTDDADFLVDFGPVLLGETVTRRYRIENVGSSGLSVEIERPSAPFSADLPASLSSLDVGVSAELRFSFLPVEESEAFEQLIEVKTNEEDAKTYRLRLRGSGVRPALRCEPEVLDFGAVLVETAAYGSALCTNPLPVGIDLSLRAFGDHARHFDASVEGASNDLVRVGAGETVRIDVEFRALSLGTNAARLELLDRSEQPFGSIPLLAEVVSSELIVQPGSCLDFLYVSIGSRSTKSFTLLNAGSEDLEIDRIEVPDEHVDDFSVLTPMPLHLEAEGGSATVEIDFHPQRGGSRQLALRIWTSEGESPVSACVTGFGGGPALACAPSWRDLGAVGIGYPATARFDCSNVGAAPEGIPIDPVVVQRVDISNEVFHSTIRNRDGTTGALSRGYQVGEGFVLEVNYDPIIEAFERTNVQVHTNVNRVDLRVAGEGRAVEPCDFALSPPSLRFGVVQRGTSRTLDLEIENQGSSSCLVADLQLSDASDPAFSMEGIDAAEIAAGKVLRIPVTFAPTAHAPSFEGKILFRISHPTLRDQEVSLSGSSANSCLFLEPADVDFGAGEPGCQAIKRRVTVSNVCGTPLEIVSVELGDSPGAEDFSIIQRPNTPLVLAPQDYADVEVSFAPLGMGAHRATLEVELAASPSVDDNVYVTKLQGEGNRSGRQTDNFTGTGKPMIDVLWVIDNSGSMGRYQERLQDNLPAFLSFATAQHADFRIGVTTTALTVGGSGCPGGADGGENGRLFPVDGSHPRILTASTPNLETHWRHNMAVGICFAPNEESALEGAFQALSPPLINETRDSRYNSGYLDGNAGFLRPDAALSVILVSDAMDYSLQPTSNYIDFFFNLKRGQRDQVRVHAISGPRRGTAGACAQYGDKMIDVVEATKGTWLSLCTPTTDTEAWSDALEAMSKGVFAFAKRHGLRGYPGDVTGDGKVTELDIEVRLDGKVEPHLRGGSRVWLYNPIANAIEFEPLYVPRTGTTITASYDLACR